MTTSQVWRSGNSQFFVRVVAGNGAVLAHSENYVAKASALNCARLLAAGGDVEDKT
jgi:uncharacterized protein YegP (UPF0339 family)